MELQEQTIKHFRQLLEVGEIQTVVCGPTVDKSIYKFRKSEVNQSYDAILTLIQIHLFFGLKPTDDISTNLLFQMACKILELSERINNLEKNGKSD